jgi:hypothetical protein
MRKAKEIPLRFPHPVAGVTDWLVMGLDPSLSRTGYALMHVGFPKHPQDLPDGVPCQHPGCLSHVSHPCEECGRTGGLRSSDAEWLQVGSIKPELAANPVWIRSKGMALFLKDRLWSWTGKATTPAGQIMAPAGIGLLVSTEFPTPMNDFLVALNRVIHLVFFEGDLWKHFTTVRILSPNAATLRSLMGLSKTGRKNKAENILRAYDFIDRAKFPKLDPDSCDAVLLAMMGRHVVSLLLDRPAEVPDRFIRTFCSDVWKAKGAGRNLRMVTAGILHRPEYFYEYKAKPYVFCARDASSPKAGLDRIEYTI